jgi:hypothetical protein
MVNQIHSQKARESHHLWCQLIIVLERGKIRNKKGECKHPNSENVCKLYITGIEHQVQKCISHIHFKD